MVNDIFTNAVELLEQAGVLDVILPFIIVFTLVYAISKSVPHLQGEDENKIRGVIAVVIGLMVIIPHATGSYPSGMDVVEIINQSIPQVALFLVAIVLAFMLIAATSFDEKESSFFRSKWVKWVALLIVGFIFLDNIGTGAVSSWPFMDWFGNEDFQALILVVLIFGLLVWFIAGGSKNKDYMCPVCEYEGNYDKVQKHVKDAKSREDNNGPHNQASDTTPKPTHG